VIVGIASAYLALLLRYGIEAISLFWTGKREWALALGELPQWLYLLAPICGGVAIGLMMLRLYPQGGLRGVPGVLADLVERGGHIDRRQWITESAGAMISMGSGFSLGREGPTVALGALVASEIASRLHLTEQQVRTLIGCGAAAGIAASFNTPIAGVLFAVEIILRDYGVATFSPIVIAAVLATIITRAEVGDFPAFTVPEYHLISAWEILAYLVIGVLCGLAAAGWIRLLAPVREGFARRMPNPVLRATTAGLLTGLIALFAPEVVSIGYGIVEKIMLEEIDPGALPIVAFFLLLLIAKFLATLIAIGGGIPGGLLGPSIFFGAVIGAIVGAAAHAIAPVWTESYGAYALVGCGALTAAAIHGPMTTILIVFEMTGDYHIMLPLMIACTVATWVARALAKDSVFTAPLAAHGIDTEGALERAWLRSVPVSRIAWIPIPSVHESATLRELKQAYVASGKGCVQVVDDDGRLIGIVTFADLQPYLLDTSRDDQLHAGDVCNREVRTIREDGSLLEAVRIFDLAGYEQLPVVSRRDPRRVLGILPRNAVFSTYHKLIVRHGEEMP